MFADRIRSLRLITCLGVAVATALVVAPAADAAPSPVGVGVARTPATDHSTFSVPVWTDAAGATVNTVTATLRDGATSVTTVNLNPGAANANLWSPAGPLQLTDDGGLLPHLGRYAIDVVATDNQGNSVERDDAGTLDFTLVPEFQLQPNNHGLLFTPATLDLQHQSTALSGLLLGEVPGTTRTVPLPDRSVTVTRSYRSDMPNRPADDAAEVTTGVDGTFTTSDFDQSWWASYTATFTEHGTEVDGTAETSPAGPVIQPTTVYITASADRTRAEPGQSVKISGTVRSGASAGSPVVVGAPIALTFTSYDDTRIVTTGQAGTFSGSFTGAGGGRAYWYAAPFGPFVSGGLGQGSVRLPDEASYTSWGISIRSDGRVLAHGQLGRTYDSNGSSTVEWTQLQYSRDGRTRWTTLSSVKVNTFSQAAPSAWGYADGYYRLYHPVSDDLAHTSTPAVHLSRILTRIYANNAAPEPIKAGRTITVTGTLQEYHSGWHAMARRTVYLYFRPRTSRTWQYVARGSSSSAGRVSVRGKASKDGYWLLQYFGDSTHFDSGASEDYVDVR